MLITAHGEEKLHPLCSLPEIVVTNATKNRSRPDGAVRLRNIPGKNGLVNTLMRSFGVVVVDIFGKNALDLSFSKGSLKTIT